MRKKEKGQSLIEIALLLPLLMMMLLGLLDFGRVYYVMVSLNDAAQEGAAYAASNPEDFAGISQRAAGASSGLVTIRQEDVMISIDSPNPRAGDPIIVTVYYEFTFYTPVATLFFPENTVELQGQATNAILRSH